MKNKRSNTSMSRSRSHKRLMVGPAKSSRTMSRSRAKSSRTSPSIDFDLQDRSFTDSENKSLTPWSPQSAYMSLPDLVRHVPTQSSLKTDVLHYYVNGDRSKGDINTWDVSYITDMSDIFYSKTGEFDGLVALNLNDWDVSHVTNMSGMFYGCKHLHTLYVQNWKTHNVSSMYNMFGLCLALKTFHASSAWNVSKLVTMFNMFAGCHTLEMLDISAWNISNVIDISSMFVDCKSLKTVKINALKVRKIEHMFKNCSMLETLNTSTWDMSNIDDMVGMFENCHSLANIIGLNTWTTTSLRTTTLMFSGCSRFNSPLDQWDTRNLNDTRYMFSGCTAFNQTLTKWNITQLISRKANYEHMFDGCTSLTRNVGKLREHIIVSPPHSKTGVKNIVSANLKTKKFGDILQLVCGNKGNCLAIGRYSNAIRGFFDDFTRLEQIQTDKIKKIGNNSANGFIVELPFVKDGFTAYTALKCSRTKDSDNLYYEYYVGKYFINNLLDRFPCFVETYGMYTFNNINAWKTVADYTTNTTPLNINTLIKQQMSFSWGKSCEFNKRVCILIQHFDNFRTLGAVYKSSINSIYNEMHNLCYQVYFPLTILGNTYTHYDLHTDNVCLYKPYAGKKYILMRYHTKTNKIFQFKSEYIAKIIDYGRNYFNNTVTQQRVSAKHASARMSRGTKINNTSDVLDELCNANECDPDCGDSVGYSIIRGALIDEFINPSQPNISHDLRLVNILKQWFINAKIFKDITYDTIYGTDEVTTDMGTMAEGSLRMPIIRNINDLRNVLESKMNKLNSMLQIQKYDNTWTQAAVMDIYEDGRKLNFVVASYIDPLHPHPVMKSKPTSPTPPTKRFLFF